MPHWSPQLHTIATRRSPGPFAAAGPALYLLPMSPLLSHSGMSPAPSTVRDPEENGLSETAWIRPLASIPTYMLAPTLAYRCATQRLKSSRNPGGKNGRGREGWLHL